MGQEQEPTGKHLLAFCACNEPGGNAGISIWRMPQHRVSLLTRFCPKQKVRTVHEAEVLELDQE